MQSLWFWNDWSATERKLFWWLTVPIGLILGLFCYIYFQYPSLAFIFEQSQEIELVQMNIRNFLVGLSTVEVPADNILLFETFSGSSLQPLPWIYYIFLLCLTIGILVYLTFITTLKKFSFFTGFGFFILIIVTLHFEALQLGGFTNLITTIVLIIIYGTAAYLFQSNYSHILFTRRLLLFSCLTFLVIVVITLTTKVPTPFLHLAVNGLIPGVAISLFFILMVAHEIVASFVTIVTNVKSPAKSAQHYYILSAIYLGNLIITFLIKAKYLYWNIFTVNSFLLLSISGILGLWGLKKREPLYASWINTSSSIFYLYLSLFLTAFATISFCFATDNSTLMEGFNDIILFTQLGYSLIFTVYVTANFGPMLMANLAVHKILYKPDTMPFLTFRTMSLIATFAFLSYSSPLTTYLSRTTAAYYNAYGDLYQMEGDLVTAEAYYKKSLGSRNQNNHAHYALATLYNSQLDPAKAVKEYTSIIKTTPSEIAYLNLSDICTQNESFDNSTDILRAGLKIFPTSGILLNAKGLYYSSLSTPDSSLLFFQKARNNSFVKSAAETNLFATGAQMKLTFPADSLLTLFGSDDTSAQSNALALANAQRLPLNITLSLPTDTILSIKMATLFSNQLTNQENKVDTALLTSIVSLARKPCNSNFKEFVLVAAAHSYYQHGRIKQASELLREIAYLTGRGKYFNLLGIWLLEQQNPATAALYFKTAQEKQISLAEMLEALAWTEADSLMKATPLWNKLASSNDSLTSSQAKLYLQILQTNKKEILSKSDQEKYGFSRYRIPLGDSLLFREVVMSITDDDMRAKAIYERSRKWYTHDETSQAIQYLTWLKGVKLRDKNLADQLLMLNLFLAVETENWDYLKTKLVIDWPQGYINEKIYFEAMLEVYHHQIPAAKLKLNYLASANFQFEEGLLAAANYFVTDTTNRLKPYGILVNGLLAKPNSIKLLKAYTTLADQLGFSEEAKRSHERLRKLMTPKAFARYGRKKAAGTQ